MSITLNVSKCTSCPDDMRQTAPEFEWWHASSGSTECLGARHRGAYNESRDYAATPTAPRHASPQAPQVVRVVDDSRRNDLPTGWVVVSCPAGATDAELLDVAGYDPRRHFGRTVTRHDDGMATVALWND